MSISARYLRAILLLHTIPNGHQYEIPSGGNDTGFDPYFLADFFLFHQDEDDPLIEWRDPSGRLREAELLVHQQAPALPPEPEAAPALSPGLEAAPGLSPGQETGPGLQPDPEEGGPSLQVDPEEGPDPHAIATLFRDCKDFRLITSKILAPSDVNKTSISS